MIDDIDFLEGDGKFTIRDESIRETAELARINHDSPIVAVNTYLDNHLLQITYDGSDDKKRRSEFRKRTASEILKSGYSNGCTDDALAFIALARELGIPTKYVETFDQEWLSNPNTNQIFGHVFVDVLVDGNWRAYDPRSGFTSNNEYTRYGKTYAEIGKGLDFSEVFIRENKGYRTEPLNLDLQTLDKVIRTFSPSISSK